MQHKARWVIILTVLIAAGLAVGTYLWSSQDKATNSNDDVNNSSQSVQAGDDSQLKTRQYKSDKGVTIEIDNWADNRSISTPLTITGRVPGNWSSEGRFPVAAVYQGDIGMPGAVAHIQGDWMTEDMVPFEVELRFNEIDDMSGEVTIALRKANPSGLAENDDSLVLRAQLD